MEDASLYWVWLSQCFPFGSPRPAELLEKGASPRELFEGGRDYRASLGLLNSRELERMDRVSLERAKGILEDCRETLACPLSETGLRFARELDSTSMKHSVCLVPSRYMEKPKYTIGLGDTFVAGVQCAFIPRP